MYSATGFTHERQRDLLMRAQQDRQVARLRKLQRASRRADRAQQSLSRALNDVLRVRGELNSG
jgi:transcription initiation factor TFIIIB Brf1 subunit/transcription initiation factor TFIIB